MVGVVSASMCKWVAAGVCAEGCYVECVRGEAVRSAVHLVVLYDGWLGYFSFCVRHLRATSSLLFLSFV